MIEWMASNAGSQEDGLDEEAMKREMLEKSINQIYVHGVPIYSVNGK